MPTSAIIHRKCPICGKLAQVQGTTNVGELLRLVKYTCGHLSTEKFAKQEADFYRDYVTETGKSAYPFQVQGMHFLERANFRALILDEMGLGKTIQAILPMKVHPELKPYLVLCKSGLKMQWFKAIIEWLGDEFMPQVVDGTDSYILPKCPGYIVSLDLLRRIRKGRKPPKKTNMEVEPNEILEDPLVKLVGRLKINYVIVDECQLVKNLGSQRTKAVQTIAKEVPHFVPLSGTPVENHTAEYFPILNMTKPEVFPQQSTFVYNWVESYWDGFKWKYGQLRSPERFRQVTQDFIIRRKRSEVMPELPTIARNFQFFELGEDLEEVYKGLYKQFKQEYFYGQGTAFERQGNAMAYISEMRHVTGLAKVGPCLEFVQEFLEDTERKLTIFTHHIDVANKLQRHIDTWLQESAFGYRTIRLEGGMSTDKRDAVQEQFLNGPERVLLASTLAAGEGLNLQVCSDCIMLEQQWVPTKEEQAECRFVRPGQTADKVTSTYFIGVGTVDEYLAEIKAHKRAIVNGALDLTEFEWREDDILRKLGEVLALRGGKKWGF